MAGLSPVLRAQEQEEVAPAPDLTAPEIPSDAVEPGGQLDESQPPDEIDPFLFPPFPPSSVAEPEGPKTAVLRALEKITARITDLDVPVGDSVPFKALTITVRTCHKRPPEETPETSAFLEVVETKPNGDVVKLFTGWMFASSPGLSALEHPVYDVWVIDCKTLAPE